MFVRFWGWLNWGYIFLLLMATASFLLGMAGVLVLVVEGEESPPLVLPVTLSHFVLTFVLFGVCLMDALHIRVSVTVVKEGSYANT